MDTRRATAIGCTIAAVGVAVTFPAAAAYGYGFDWQGALKCLGLAFMAWGAWKSSPPQGSPSFRRGVFIGLLGVLLDLPNNLRGGFNPIAPPMLETAGFIVLAIHAAFFGDEAWPFPAGATLGVGFGLVALWGFGWVILNDSSNTLWTPGNFLIGVGSATAAVSCWMSVSQALSPKRRAA